MLAACARCQSLCSGEAVRRLRAPERAQQHPESLRHAVSPKMCSACLQWGRIDEPQKRTGLCLVEPRVPRPQVQKFVIGGRFETRDDPEQPFCRRNIGGRFVQAFVKTHRITLSNSPQYYGSPGYAHMNGTHLLVWLADPEKQLGFREQLKAVSSAIRLLLTQKGGRSHSKTMRLGLAGHDDVPTQDGRSRRQV